jgi:hypothetical protein
MSNKTYNRQSDDGSMVPVVLYDNGDGTYSESPGPNTPQTIAASDDSIITPLTVSTAIYAAKESIGGKITIADAVREAGKSSILHSLMLLDKSGQKPTGFIMVFNTDPTAATITDNAAFDSSTNDVNVCAIIPITASDWYTPGVTKAYANIRNIGALVEPLTGTSLYAAFISDGTPDLVATTDLQIIWGFLR